MGLEEDFEKAAEEATTLLPSSLPNENQLQLYSLFKQAKFGDNDTRELVAVSDSDRLKFSQTWFLGSQGKG